MIAHNPLHRSGQAVWPHPALALGDDAKATQRIGMTHARKRQPAVEQTPHTVPADAAGLAAPAQRAMPEAAHLKPKQMQRRAVHRYSVITDVAPDDRAQPLTLHRDRRVHASPQFGFHRIELRLQALAHRLPQHREASITSFGRANVREAKKVERLGLTQAHSPASRGRIRAELQQSGLLGMQLQCELGQPLGQLAAKPLGIRLHLESDHDVISVAHDHHCAVCSRATPRANPQVKRIVKIDIGQQRRCTATLWRTLLHIPVLTVFQHPRVQPFLDKPQQASVGDAVLDKLDQPAVVDRIKERTQVKIKHPVHRSRKQSRVKRIQAIMLAAPRTKPIRESEEVRFIDSVEHLNSGTLDQFVLQRGHAQWALPATILGDVHPTYWLGSVGAAFKPFGEVLEMLLQGLAVVPPRLPVDPRSRFLLQTEVSRPQGVQVIDMVQQRGEPHRPIFLCCLTYPLERSVHAVPALYPERVLLWQVPFGQAPSLHPLRDRCSGLVRGLRRYYGPVRLPLSVHRRRTSIDFPTRPATSATAGRQGISRFSREAFPYVHGVSDRAGSLRILRYRRTGCGLPLFLTASAPRRTILSRLNTRPVRTPVNASAVLSRAPPHDSGPAWIASPSLYGWDRNAAHSAS